MTHVCLEETIASLLMKKNNSFMYEISALAVIVLAVALSISGLRETSRSNSVTKETIACFEKYTSISALDPKVEPKEGISYSRPAYGRSAIFKFVIPIELPKINSITIPVTPIEIGVDTAEWVRFYVFMAGDLKNPISNGVRYLGPLSASVWNIGLSGSIVRDLHGDYVDLYIETNVFDQLKLTREPVSSADITMGKICSQAVEHVPTSYKKINIEVSGGT